MASLPSAVIGNTIKLESEFKKRSTTFPSIEKRNPGYLDKDFDALSLDFKESEPSNYVTLLQKCVEKNSIKEAKMIHGQIVKSGTNDNLFVMTSLVNVYGKCGAMEEARKVFDGLAKRNVVTWTSLMSGYVQNAQPELAASVFLEMLENGAFPTNYTIGVVLNACSVLYDVKLGKEVHGYVVKYGLEDDTSVGNALCNLYSKCGNNLDSVMKVFSRIGERNVVSWTTIVSACGDNGSSADGLNLFSELLEEGIEPNELILTSVLRFIPSNQMINHVISVKMFMFY